MTDSDTIAPTSGETPTPAAANRTIPVRRVNRRQALAALGTVSLASLITACRTPGSTGSTVVTTTVVPTTEGATATVAPQTTSAAGLADRFDQAAVCTLSPEQTEGPYYFDVDSIRTDIREDREGAVLRLGVRVRESTACVPLANAVVDVWHCDAVGLYSGFESASTGGGGGGGQGGGPTDEETYLRGAQVTNGDGIAEFVTIYPGWYRGRTVHIHTKVHLDRATVLTTQFYFDEAVTDTVYAAAPYASETGRDTRNANDGIFDERTVLTVSETEEGWLGLITLDVAAA